MWDPGRRLHGHDDVRWNGWMMWPSNDGVWVGVIDVKELRMPQ
jgi:hypothetical protein